MLNWGRSCYATENAYPKVFKLLPRRRCCCSDEKRTSVHETEYGGLLPAVAEMLPHTVREQRSELAFSQNPIASPESWSLSMRVFLPASAAVGKVHLNKGSCVRATVQCVQNQLNHVMNNRKGESRIYMYLPKNNVCFLKYIESLGGVIKYVAQMEMLGEYREEMYHNGEKFSIPKSEGFVFFYRKTCYAKNRNAQEGTEESSESDIGAGRGGSKMSV